MIADAMRPYALYGANSSTMTLTPAKKANTIMAKKM